jgi:hypothetical protein
MNGNLEKFVYIGMRKMYSSIKNSLHFELLMLLEWQILLGRKCIERATDILIMWKNGGANLCLFLKWLIIMVFTVL